MTAHDPIGAPDAVFRELFVSAEEGVRLRVLHWKPRGETSDAPLIFVAGWVSHVLGWADVLRAAAPNREICYVETREKTSAAITRPGLRRGDFSIERIAADLCAVIPQLPVDASRAVVMASSLGATAVLEAMKDGGLRPAAAFLIGPNTEFHAPWYLRWVPFMPLAIYPAILRFAIWYMRRFRVDSKNEPEQMRRYEETLLAAHPARLKLSAQAVMRYTVWRGLETIQIPVALAFADTDKLHGRENIQRLANALPRAALVPCPSNKYMHRADVLDDLTKFLRQHELENR
ncbi:MAG: alpha/beta fold hydrolase [Deltaproteobacteria bacterium]|nr:alpha/beta fold hydrolase [Deltaproteobacteria bacterium]